jgi:hypothetical protein
MQVLITACRSVSLARDQFNIVEGTVLTTKVLVAGGVTGRGPPLGAKSSLNLGPPLRSSREGAKTLTARRLQKRH